MNPDLVGEVRMILAPVDAEVGRGNVSDSGPDTVRNQHVSRRAVWNVRNSALDPNTWANKRVRRTSHRGFTNIHEYTVSVGGPIVRNKTFFFALWDGLFPRAGEFNATILTPCARKGIFRLLRQLE